MLMLILTCLVCVARPACARYVYNAHPASGYVVPAGDDSAQCNKPSTHNRYNTKLKNMKLVNERAVDSYFRILGATPQALAAAGNDRRPVVDTEPPTRHYQQKLPAKNTAYAPQDDPRNVNHNENERTFTIVDQYTKRSKQNAKDLTKHSAFDKHTILAKGSKNYRRPNRAQNVHHIMYFSQIRDKILHKADLNSDTALAMSSPHTGMPRPELNKLPYTYRPKDIDKGSIPETADENDHEVHSSNYKHVTVEDRFLQGWRRNIPARDGGYLEKEASQPYALFYRMNHEPELEHEAPLDACKDSYHHSRYLDLNTARKHSSAIL